MPETSSENVRCGQHQANPQRDKIKQLEDSRPPPLLSPPPPPPPDHQTMDMVSPPASESQVCNKSHHTTMLEQTLPLPKNIS